MQARSGTNVHGQPCFMLRYAQQRPRNCHLHGLTEGRMIYFSCPFFCHQKHLCQNQGREAVTNLFFDGTFFTTKNSSGKMWGKTILCNIFLGGNFLATKNISGKIRRFRNERRSWLIREFFSFVATLAENYKKSNFSNGLMNEKYAILAQNVFFSSVHTLAEK